MAFFNYSTMQMTAKIVYYGPGLGGKTTNLEFIHRHTTKDSRGEMVSLETQTDRTLFFDLLPLEVGTVAGFRTRIQLYTVPGQVFYNTTRKLVLKGVDGVVFVADSQRPMLDANVDSLHNLEENLASLGLSIETVPLVIQYNKRDLKEITPVAELDRVVNRNGNVAIEASALYGTGVFETLQAISRLTLIALKKQLETAAGVSQVPHRRETASRPPAPPSPAPGSATPTPPPAARTPTVKPAPAAKAEERPGNGRGGVSRDLLLRMTRGDFERTAKVLISLQLQDDQQEILHEVRDLQWEIPERTARDRLDLRLNIALNPKD